MISKTNASISGKEKKREERREKERREKERRREERATVREDVVSHDVGATHACVRACVKERACERKIHGIMCVFFGVQFHVKIPY